MIYNITIIGNKLHFQTQLDSSPAFLCIPVSFLCIPVHSCAFLCIPVHSCAFLCIPVHSCAFLCIPGHSCAFLCIPVHSCLIPVSFLCIPVSFLQIPVSFLWIPAESRNSRRNLWGSEKYWLDCTKFDKECQFCDGFDNDNCPL